MVIGTFGPTTAWNGKTIIFENESFILEGHGTITAQDVVAYAVTGHLTWADEGLRQWVETTAAREQKAAQPEAEMDSDAQLSTENTAAEGEATERPALTSVVDAPAEGPAAESAVIVASSESPASTLPDTKRRKAMRVLTTILAVLALLATAGEVLGNTGSSSPAYADPVLDFSFAALVALVAVAILAYRLGMHPRALIWLKVAATGLLAASGGVYASGAAMDASLLSGMAGRLGLPALATWIAVWTVPASLAVVTILIHDRAPRPSVASPNGIAWRLRWPHWMWVPCVLLIGLGPISLASVLLSGTAAAYLVVWSARRCLTGDGARLRWPGRGWPAAAGIIGVLLAIPVLTGVVGQQGGINAQLQKGSTQSSIAASEAPADSGWVAYASNPSGFAFKYPSGLFTEVSDSASLQPIRDMAPGATVCAFQSTDQRYVFAVAARREATTKQMRNAGRAMYEYVATEMAKPLRRQTVGATDVTARSGRLGGSNGTLITYTKAGAATGEPTAFTWYHLYGRGLIVDVFATRPLAGSSTNADNVSRMLRSFRMSD